MGSPCLVLRPEPHLVPMFVVWAEPAAYSGPVSPLGQLTVPPTPAAWGQRSRLHQARLVGPLASRGVLLRALVCFPPHPRAAHVSPFCLREALPDCSSRTVLCEGPALTGQQAVWGRRKTPGPGDVPRPAPRALAPSPSAAPGPPRRLCLWLCRCASFSDPGPPPGSVCASPSARPLPLGLGFRLSLGPSASLCIRPTGTRF